MFGRDEGGSEFTFKQSHIDELCVCCLPRGSLSLSLSLSLTVLVVVRRLTKWIELQGRAASGTSWRNAAGARKQPPAPDKVFCLDLCISDHNKTLLLANPNFIPYL